MGVDWNQGRGKLYLGDTKLDRSRAIGLLSKRQPRLSSREGGVTGLAAG
jgi:hypothetical protein